MLVKNLKAYPAHFIRRIHQIATALFVHACLDYELTPVQFAALTAIQGFPNSDQTTLAGLIGYDRATMGKVLEILEKRNWIERRTDPNNRRTKLVRIKKPGLKLLAEVEPRIQALNQKLISPLNKSEQKEFMRLLEKIVEAQNESSRAPVRSALKN